MYGRGSTNIDDLLDLDDPSDGSEGFSNRNVGSYTNAIRSNSYTMKGNAIDGANKIKQQRHKILPKCARLVFILYSFSNPTKMYFLLAFLPIYMV